MSSLPRSYGLGDLKGDVFGGVVSAVMMVPVALGFGVLSGLGPVAAFYGAIAVGFLTAVLGGAAPMISGPSAIVTISRRSSSAPTPTTWPRRSRS